MEQESIKIMANSLGEKIIELCYKEIKMPFDVYLCTFLSLAASLIVKSAKSMDEFYQLKGAAEHLLEASFKNVEEQIKERLKCPGSTKE